MGINFGEDIVQRNLKILDALKPNMTTSLQVSRMNSTDWYSKWSGWGRGTVSSFLYIQGSLRNFTDGSAADI